MAAPMALAGLALTDSGRPVLLEGEVERVMQDKVDLVFVGFTARVAGSAPVDKLEDGHLTVTTHRVLWVDAGAAPSTGASCALPLAALGRAELRATRLWSSQKVRLHVRADRAGVLTAAPDGATREVKVIAPGQAALLAAVQASLVARAWERAGGGEPSPTASPPVDDGLLAAVVAMGYGVQRAARALRATGGTDAQEAVLWLMEREGDASLDEPLDEGPGPGAALGAPRSSAALNAASAGVAGILNREAQAAASTDRAVEEAFRDLRALMASAADMVQLAQRYREAQAGGDVSFEDELAAIGIASPVTRDSAGALYIAELSKQLADFLGPRVAAAGGMLPLTDAFCLFNRARGAELASPADVLAAARAFERVGAPVRLREFDSGVLAVQALSHTDSGVFARLVQLAAPHGEAERAPDEPTGLGPPLTASDVAAALSMPLAVAAEHLKTAEAAGVLCRDEGPEGLRFFRNFFMEHAVKDSAAA